MPIYEYKCASCGHQQEYIQKVSDPVLTTCPACANETYGKMLTAAGFQLKGSGWYATDFKNAGTKPGAKPAEKSDGSAKPAEKSDSTAKPESKSDTSGAGATGTVDACGAACACS